MTVSATNTRRFRAFGAAAAIGLLATGCASRAPGSSGSGAVESSESVSSPSAVVIVPSASPSSTAPTHPTASSTGVAAVNGCTAAQLTTTVQRGSGASQTQYAIIQFANRSLTPCTLTGFPGVSLLAGGKSLASPAERSSTTSGSVTLASGGTATADVTDYSSCNAATSDTVRIYPPNQSTYVDLPITLRGCRLVVDPIKIP